MKACPHCAEEIQDTAVVCRYCGRDVPQALDFRCGSCGHGSEAPDHVVVEGRPIPVCPSCQAVVGSDRSPAPPSAVAASSGADRGLIRGGWRLVAVSLIFPVAYLAAFVVGLIAIVRGQVFEPVVMMLVGGLVSAVSSLFWTRIVVAVLT